MTTDAHWTRFVRMWRDVGVDHRLLAVAAERERDGVGCVNSRYRCTWCTCCP